MPTVARLPWTRASSMSAAARRASSPDDSRIWTARPAASRAFIGPWAKITILDSTINASARTMGSCDSSAVSTADIAAREGGLVVVDHVEGVRALGPQFRTGAIVELVGVLQQHAQGFRGLPVRIRLLGVRGRDRPVLDQELDPVRRHGMVDDPGRLDARLSEQHVQHLTVGLHEFADRQRRLDRSPGELVPERDMVIPAADHTGPLGLQQDVVLVAGERLGQPPFGARRYDGDALDEPSDRGRQPSDSGQYGVAHRGGHAVAAGLEHFGHEERIAPRDAVNLGRLGFVHTGQSPYRLDAQRCQFDAPIRRTVEATEDASQRVSRIDIIVAEGQQQDRRHSRDAAGQVADRVQGRVVGPVDVLQHHDRRSGGEESQ